MKHIWISLFALCCFAANPAQAARKALLLGNTNYTQVKKLSGPTADVEDMATSLQALGFEHHNILVKTNKNLQETQDAAREFRAMIQEGDEVLIYYSGHAVQLGGGNYLLPTDVPNRGQIDSEQTITDRTVRLQRFLSDASERKARFTLLIVDACRDNPIQVPNGKSIHTGQGLTVEAPSNGQMIVFAAGANQVAKDKLYDSDRNSLFTGVLLQKMRTPGLEIRDLFAQVKEEVYTQARKVGHEQLPSLYDQSLGKFYFAGVKATPVATDAREASMARLQQEKEQLVQELTLAQQRLTSKDIELDGFILLPGGVAKDKATGLEWMRCSLGQTWDGNTCTGEAKTYKWQEALDAAKKLNGQGGFAGSANWRVPTIRELHGLVDCSKGIGHYTTDFHDGGPKVKDGCLGEGYARPTIKQRVFPNTPNDRAWSSSPDASGSDYAWLVFFGSGNDGSGYSKYGAYRVRLVRSGQ